MKKNIIFIFVLFLGVNIFLGTFVFNKKYIYDTLVREKSNIVEQGVKVQYNYDDFSEYEEIRQDLNVVNEFELYDENFYYLEENSNYSIEIKGIDFFVEIEIKVFNDKVGVEELEKNLISKFKDKQNLQTFSYLKGKLKNKHNLDLEFKSLERNLKSIDSIEIENGITGNITLYNNEVFNYSIISYDKDNNYIIVGSPVIFTTY